MTSSNILDLREQSAVDRLVGSGMQVPIDDAALVYEQRMQLAETVFLETGKEIEGTILLRKEQTHSLIALVLTAPQPSDGNLEEMFAWLAENGIDEHDVTMGPWYLFRDPAKQAAFVEAVGRPDAPIA